LLCNIINVFKAANDHTSTEQNRTFVRKTIQQYYLACAVHQQKKHFLDSSLC